MADVELRRFPFPVRESLWTELIRKEDWWAVWISLSLIGVAVARFASGGVQSSRRTDDHFCT